jgi:hypothetical protein
MFGKRLILSRAGEHGNPEAGGAIRAAKSSSKSFDN